MSLYDRRHARRSLFDTVIFRALSQAATLAGYVVMVRAMSREAFGVYNLLYALIPVISTVASLGLEQTLRRYQPEYLRANEHAAAARLVSVVSGARLATTAAVIGLILLTWDTVAPVFQLGPYRQTFAIFGVVVLLHFQARVLQLSLASYMLHRYGTGMLTVLSVVRLIAWSAFALFGELTLQAAILSDIAAYALAYTGLRAAHARYCRPGLARGFRFAPQERRRMLRYAIAYNFNDAGSIMLNVRADNFFIAALMNPVAVGIYAFYTRLAQMAGNLLPTRMFENVVQPLFFATRREDADRRLPVYFTALLNTSLLVQVPMLAFTIAYHRELVEVFFGEKYLEHSAMLPLVFAFATVNVIANPITLVAQYAEKPHIILLSKIFAIYNVAALLLLIPRAGVAGAAVASGSAALLKNLFIWWHVRHSARWLNAPAVLSASVLVWGTFIAAGLGLKAALQAPPLVHLLCGVVLGAAAGVIYLRSAVLSPADRHLFATVLHGREARILRWLGVV